MEGRGEGKYEWEYGKRSRFDDERQETIRRITASSPQVTLAPTGRFIVTITMSRNLIVIVVFSINTSFVSVTLSRLGLHQYLPLTRPWFSDLPHDLL